MRLSVKILTLVDRRASPNAENYVMAKIGPGLHKASIHIGGPGTSCCPVLSWLKRFGVDVRRYVDPCSALVSEIIAFPEAKIG